LLPSSAKMLPVRDTTLLGTGGEHVQGAFLGVLNLAEHSKTKPSCIALAFAQPPELPCTTTVPVRKADEGWSALQRGSPRIACSQSPRISSAFPGT